MCVAEPFMRCGRVDWWSICSWVGVKWYRLILLIAVVGLQ